MISYAYIMLSKLTYTCLRLFIYLPDGRWITNMQTLDLPAAEVSFFACQLL